VANKKIIILIFSIALISGFFWNQKMFGQPIGSDQVLYDSAAQNLQQEAGIEPLYPLFLAGIYGVFGHNYDAVRIIQIFLFALTAVFVYLLAEKIFNQKIAVISGIITALFYGLANQASNITTETLFIFLIVLLAYALFKGRFAVSGIVLGLATLTRGIIQFFAILIALNIIIVFYKKTSLKNTFLKAGVFLVGFLIILIPWQIKIRSNNVLVAPRGGEILSVRAELMENLYHNYPAHLIGHLFGYYFSQKVYPDISSTVFRETPKTKQVISDLLKSGRCYGETDKILLKEAKIKILAAPHKYVLMSVLDFISFNSPIIPRGSLWQNTLTIHPMFAEGRQPNIPEWAKTVIILDIRLVWFAFLFLVIYGLIKNLKKWDKIGWLFLIIIYFNLAYSAVHAIPRYALPIYPFYVILAVVGISILWEKLQLKRLFSLRASPGKTARI